MRTLIGAMIGVFTGRRSSATRKLSIGAVQRAS